MQSGLVRLTVLALMFAWVIFSVGGVGNTAQCPGVTHPLSPILNSYQQLTVSTTAIALTVPRGSKMAVVTVESNPIRYRDDFTDPTAAVGVLAASGASLVLCGDSASRFKAIRQGASDAILNVSYYGG